MKKILLVVAVLGLLTPAGCGSHSGKSIVIMQHPETMEFVDCRVDAWATPHSYAKNSQCVEDLKKQGYVVWGQR